MKSIAEVSELVIKAGKHAQEMQSQISVYNRDLKKDGSPVTKADFWVEDFLCENIAKIAPDANLVTEERVRHFDPLRDFTFIIDPIDGTDSFRQKV